MKWVAAVQTLRVVAKCYPQTAYAGFTFCLQNKWQYVQRVVADTAPFFAPLEEAIRTHFLPSLLGLPLTEIDGDYRQLLTHSVKMGGLAIRNPMDKAPRVHLALIAATHHLTASLVQAATWFDLGTHRTCTNEAGLAARRDRLQDKGIFFDRQGKDNPLMARRNRQNCAAGAWLSVFPNRLNGTGPLADEWHDNVQLRYNHSLLDIPTACDCCGAAPSGMRGRRGCCRSRLL